MRFDIATLFPEMCETVVNSSIIGRGIKAGKLEVHCHQIRDYTTDKHRRKAVSEQIGQKPYVIYLSPQGKVLTQAHARELKEKESLFLLCGHYEGVDQRVLDEIVDEELSIGDYVLTGGELGALVLVDCIGLKDTPVVVACVLVLATMFTIINLCIDILYAFLDPRIRAQYKTAKR